MRDSLYASICGILLLQLYDKLTVLIMMMTTVNTICTYLLLSADISQVK